MQVLQPLLRVVRNLVRRNAFRRKLRGVDRQKAFAHAGVFRIDAADDRAGIFLHKLLCENRRGVDRAGLLQRAADINDVAALVEILPEDAVKLLHGNLRRCDAVAVAHEIVHRMHFIGRPGKVCGRGLALENRVHLGIVDVVTLHQLRRQVGAGIGDDLNLFHNTLLIRTNRVFPHRQKTANFV